MPGFLLHQGATVLCSHGGQAQPTVPSLRVTVSNQAVTLLQAPYTIAGCALPPPIVANGPCVTAAWVSGASRITSEGVPVLLQDSQAICAPTGTPLLVAMTQMRVKGT